MEMYKSAKSTKRIPPIKDCNGKWAKTSLEKANTFDEVIEFLESPDQLDLPITPFTQTEVRGIISKH